MSFKEQCNIWTAAQFIVFRPPFLNRHLNTLAAQSLKHHSVLLQADFLSCQRKSIKSEGLFGFFFWRGHKKLSALGSNFSMCLNIQSYNHHRVGHPLRTTCPKINACDSLNESTWEQPFLSTEAKQIDSTPDFNMAIIRWYESIPEPKKPLHRVNIFMGDFTESFFLLLSKGHWEPNFSLKTWKINRGSSLHTLHPRQEIATAHLPLAVRPHQSSI